MPEYEVGRARVRPVLEGGFVRRAGIALAVVMLIVGIWHRSPMCPPAT